MPRYSKNALNCSKCPGKAGDGGCPMWWNTVHTDGATIKTISSCGYEQLPLYLIEVVKASNRPAAAVESCRNEVALGLARVASVMADAVSLAMPGMMIAAREKSLEIEDGTE